MRLKLLALAVAALVPYANPASAQSNWPTRPVTLVVGFAAGGGTDVLARIVARKLSEVLGQQIIVENVGGAGGMVASARVVKSPPDGYTIVMGTGRMPSTRRFTRNRSTICSRIWCRSC